MKRLLIAGAAVALLVSPAVAGAQLPPGLGEPDPATVAIAPVSDRGPQGGPPWGLKPLGSASFKVR